MISCWQSKKIVLFGANKQWVFLCNSMQDSPDFGCMAVIVLAAFIIGLVVACAINEVYEIYHKQDNAKEKTRVKNVVSKPAAVNKDALLVLKAGMTCSGKPINNGKNRLS